MSAIAGLIGQGLKDTHLNAMLDSAHFRGPEGAGYFRHGNLHMGARHLAVTDRAHGIQPHFAKGGAIAAFLNGEIYNHGLLRQELEVLGYRFKTDCDTEVVAQAYAAWGWPGFLQRLDGMFAVAIVDLKSNQLFLARDRFGEKPLYFTHCDDGFAYGSTLLSVSAMPWVSGDWDGVGLDYYLSLQFVPGSRTLLNDVEQLLPGESLVLDLQSLTYIRYRYYIPSPARQAPLDTALEDAIVSAVGTRLEGEAAIGVVLSGGLGSALVASLAASRKPGIKTYAVGIESADSARLEYAARVAKHVGSDHTVVNLTLNDLIDALPRVAEKLDTPVGDPDLLPLFCLSETACAEMDAVLVECGAEESFAGHRYYRSILGLGASHSWVARLSKWVSRWKGRGAPSACKSDPCPGLFDEANRILRSGLPIALTELERAEIMAGMQGRVSCDNYGRWLVARIREYESPLLQSTLCDVLSGLPDHRLVAFDRMTMAHGLESRSPYLSHGLVEMGLALPDGDRMTAQDSLIALKRIAGKYLTPQLVKYPEASLKFPLATFLPLWFERVGGAGHYLKESGLLGIAVAPLTRIIENDLAQGVKRGRLLFSIVMLVEWWKSFSVQRAKLLEVMKRPN